jgi:hypothetical protein
MGTEQPSNMPERVRGVERSFQVEVRGLGGFELRPTRLFVWGGNERATSQRVLPLGSAPRSLTIPRRRRERQTGAVELTTLGNPVLTIALAGVHAARAVRRSVRR